RKINIDTDNRMAMTGAIRKILAEKPGEFDPRAYLKPAKEAMRKLCQERFVQFGCEGMASKIKPLSTAQMARRYASGELTPHFGKASQAAA
ncbi:MAG: class II fructose-bisphosphate aldolase, partial [Alphaproteobacteria bacterium]|nr:class II fructose-bisphosphate aldolase [Alphaproteobacteria bacterium]